MTTTALIVAAGKGERLGGGVPKQYRVLGGKPVLRWAAEAMLRHPAVRDLCVVIGAGQEMSASSVLEGLNASLIQGGAERADSVRAGLEGVVGEAVLVHDAARPFCPSDVIDRLLASLEFFDGAAPVLPVGDTLARGGGETIEDLVDRSGLIRVQTPQAFRVGALKAAYANWSGPTPTDETTVLRAAGLKVAAVAGDPQLEKLTLPADFARAEQWLAGRMVPRTGMGFDVHAFAGEGPLMLGGIAVPHDRGLKGHSDADVVLHAVTDALLGAVGLGDIGEHFPPSDPQWKGAESAQFLAHAAAMARAEGASIDHVDCTIICEAPKVGPHRPAMRQKIAEILGIDLVQVSVKATTTEGLGFTGRREGIAAQAVASVRMGATW